VPFAEHYILPVLPDSAV